MADVEELAAAKDKARKDWDAGLIPWHELQHAIWVWKRERDRLRKLKVEASDGRR
jgi:hypothetical protein